MVYAEKKREESPYRSVNDLAKPKKHSNTINPTLLTPTGQKPMQASASPTAEILQFKKEDPSGKYLEGIGTHPTNIKLVDKNKNFLQNVNTDSLTNDENTEPVEKAFIVFLKEIFPKVIENDSLYTAFKNLLAGHGFITNTQYYLKKRDELAKTAGGTVVAKAQASLLMAGYDLGKYGVDGVQGKENSYTTRAIKEFQLAVGIYPTGNLDPQTIFALNIIVQAGLKKKEIEALGELLGHYDLTWPTKSQRITSPFSQRIHPITGKQQSHGGIDIGPMIPGTQGDKIVAALSGKVIKLGFQFDEEKKTGAGLYLVIESIYKGQKLHIYYMHLKENSVVVQENDFVKAGQHIANMGATGGATGPHLHFEIRVMENGKWVKKDPMSWQYKQKELEQ